MLFRPWIAARAPSLGILLAGHSVAGLLFCFTFPNPALRPVWLPQFYVLLSLATVLLLLVPRFQKNVHRIVVLLGAMIVEVVIGIPRDPSWQPGPCWEACSFG